MRTKSPGILVAILFGGVIAATVDIGAASIISGRSPTFIMQAIAAGLLGKASFGGGVPTMMLGAFLQEAMGILIAGIYVLAIKALPALSRHWALSGLGYGVVIFFVMNYAVVPLSALKVVPQFTALKFAENMTAMLIFGLIVAFFCARAMASAEPARNEAIVPA